MIEVGQIKWKEGIDDKKAKRKKNPHMAWAENFQWSYLCSTTDFKFSVDLNTSWLCTGSQPCRLWWILFICPCSSLITIFFFLKPDSVPILFKAWIARFERMISSTHDLNLISSIRPGLSSRTFHVTTNVLLKEDCVQNIPRLVAQWS
jgi:hypothetical protein